MKHLKIKIDLKLFGEKEVLRNIELTINESDKIAIVGPNGAGKTTFLKILVGEDKDFDGFIENVGNLSLGYLRQVNYDNEETTVYDELKSAFREIIEIEKKLKEYEEKMALESENMQIMEEYSSLLEQFNNIGGYDYDNKIHGVANGMGILDLLDKKLLEISGGQRTKISLAKILLQAPDILFLDEPTNFIDMAGVEWLESYLQNKWKGGYVIISHDREFLDKTCNKTIELQPLLPIEIYHTNYSGYLLERERREKKKLKMWEIQQEYIQKQEGLINRFRAGSRAGWAKSREKMLEKMEKLEKPYIPKKAKFIFNYIGESPEKLLSFKEVFIGRKEPLFYVSEAILHKGQRIGIVGENGVGKSTFIKSIIGKIPILDGNFVKGKGLKYLYYSQMHEELYKDLSVRDNFKKFGLDYPDEHLISILKHYLFEKEIIEQKVKNLSGGQTSKLLFAIIGQLESNLLILDEPTNHLDYDTREALEQALQKYEGTILFISHDRYFVNKLATNIWFIDNGELSISYGNYEDYRFKLENGIDMDFNLFDEEAELNLALESKLDEKQLRKIKNKFGDRKKRKN